MSGIADEANHEFWRPPAIVSHPSSAAAAAPALVGACSGCGAEFMVASRFCHVCGTRRNAVPAPARNWARHLELHNLQRVFGLSAAPLVAFLIGVGCIVAAISMGYIFSVQNFADFQAVQLFRLQWLVGAVVSFLAGILLKRTSQPEK